MPGIPGIELGQGRSWNTFQHLFGENSEELPPDVQRLKDRPRKEHGLEVSGEQLIEITPVLVVPLCDEIFLELAEELQVEKVVSGEGLLAHHGLHGLHVLPCGDKRGVSREARLAAQNTVPMA